MKANWYPQDKKELNRMLEKFLITEKKEKNINGIIVPHAGYIYSGEVAGKAFGLINQKKLKRAIVFGPSHYAGFYGIESLQKIETPFGKVKVIENGFEKLKIPIKDEENEFLSLKLAKTKEQVQALDYEHSVDNQIPFLQFLNSKIEVLPLVVGEISNEDVKRIAESFINFDGLFVFSTDLSHFFQYETARIKDERTIKIIEELNFKRLNEIDACGKFPLLIAMYLCKLKKFKPKLVEYKNSGDVTGDKSSVVGYASFIF
jgi:MEMO1 family protein